MEKILVSIISEHLIPNFHLYKHLNHLIDGHLLISTQKMIDNKFVDNYIKFIGDKPYQIILIDASNLYNITNVINDYTSKNNHEYFVNLTGGTKMISIACYEAFRNHKSKMYYVEIAKNNCIVLDEHEIKTEPFNHEITLKEYLGLYGYDFNSNQKLAKTPAQTKLLFNKIKEKNYNALSHQLIKDVVLNNLKLNDENESNYYKGLWFEEYIFNLFKDKNQLNSTQIALNVQVRKYKAIGYNDNEFDVMFIKNNKLYVIECKSSIGKYQEYDKNMEAFLYKLRASVKEFGLQVIPILAVCNLNPKRINNNYAINERADILDIKIIDGQHFEKNNLFDLFIKQL